MGWHASTRIQPIRRLCSSLVGSRDRSEPAADLHLLAAVTSSTLLFCCLQARGEINAARGPHPQLSGLLRQRQQRAAADILAVLHVQDSSTPCCRMQHSADCHTVRCDLVHARAVVQSCIACKLDSARRFIAVHRCSRAYPSRQAALLQMLFGTSTPGCTSATRPLTAARASLPTLQE